MAKRQGSLKPVAVIVAIAAGFFWLVTLTSYLDQRDLQRRGQAAEAVVDRIEKIGSGRRAQYVVHYHYEFGGKVHSFDDRGDDGIEDYVRAYGVAGEEGVAEGTRVAILVDPEKPERHVADRRTIGRDWLNTVFTVVAGTFLTALAIAFCWLAFPRKRSPAPPPAG